MIKIYSHPRSGTHFLEAFVAENFYEGINLSSEAPIHYGHWSDKKLLEKGEPHHKLFGSHFFPEELELENNKSRIYIYRDVRAVAASIYNSKYYDLNKHPTISFSEFLKMKLDWHGGLGRKYESDLNIIQHWYRHVDSWLQLPDKKLLVVRYEDLKLHPEMVYQSIVSRFFKIKKWKNFVYPHKIKIINNKVGLHPNKATIDSWKSLFTDQDLDFVMKNLPSDKYLFNA